MALTLCKPPLWTGVLGAVALMLVASWAHAAGFLRGAVLVVAALAASAGFYMRSAVSHPGLMLFRLLVALVVKWSVLLGGAGYVLSQGSVAPGAFVAGIVAALIATLFGRGFNNERIDT
jgi:hypothetical protein